MADKLMLYKYVVKNVAYAAGYTATFMPKPLFQDNGSGMHCHQSLWKDGEPLFFGDGYGGLSDIGRWYVGGLLKHARAVLGVRRTDHELLQAAGARLRGAGQPGVLAAQPLGGLPDPALLPEPQGQADRVPLPRRRPATRTWPSRRCCMAGLDGVQNKIEPPDPVDKDLFDLPAAELAKIAQIPGSLDEALEALEADNEFLRVGGVFTDDLIETWIDYKRLRGGRRDPAAAAPLRVHALLRHLALTWDYVIPSHIHPTFGGIV